jgi:hypothetical protein
VLDPIHLDPGIGRGKVQVPRESCSSTYLPWTITSTSFGSTIPLVARRRSVAVIDWWIAVPQMPPGETLTATATLNISGPLIGNPGVLIDVGGGQPASYGST